MYERAVVRVHYYRYNIMYNILLHYALKSKMVYQNDIHQGIIVHVHFDKHINGYIMDKHAFQM